MTATPSQKKLNDSLLLAAYGGAVEDVAKLLALGANPQADGSLALFRAAQNGHANCVRILIPVSRARDCESGALQWAAARGHADCVELLIPASDPCASDSHALRRAAMHGHAECVKLLIPVSDPKARFSEALRFGIRNGHVDCVSLLLAPSHRLADHLGLFHEAVEGGCAKIVGLMIAHEPELASMSDFMELSRQAFADGRRELSHLLFSIAESRSIASALSASDSPCFKRCARRSL